MVARRGVILLLSAGPDEVGAAFADHCRTRGVDVVLATSQRETQFYVEISGSSCARLRVQQPDGAADIEPGDLRGIWFRDLPGVPAGLDDEDALYACTEFGAALIGYCRVGKVPCLGFPVLTSLLEDVATMHQVRDWCRHHGIAVLPPNDDRHLAPIPLHPDVRPASSDGPGIDTARTWCGGADNHIYYVLLGQRRQVLAQESMHQESTLRSALDAGDRVSAMLALDSGVLEFAPHDDAGIALGEILPAVPDGVILRDQAWYFDAVLDAFYA